MARLGEEGGDVAWWLELARLELIRGNAEGAKEAAEAALAVDPGCLEARALIG